MNTETILGILIPFIGTSLGAAMVFVLRKEISTNLQKILTGFAAGVMVAASFWSLLQPALESSEHMGTLAFLPAAVGFLIGVGFLLLLDKLIPHMHLHDDCPEGIRCNLGKSTMMVLAVALHNLPEGMAVGVVAAGWLTGSESISYAGALALSLGIALQNLGMLSGEMNSYGLYVKTVNGITLDYNKDGMYWGFYIDGEYAMTGVDMTEIVPGSTYTLKADK